MENWVKFKYLRGKISAVGRGALEKVTQRLQEGNKIFGNLGKLEKERTITPEIKRALYERVVILTVVYGFERG